SHRGPAARIDLRFAARLLPRLPCARGEFFADVARDGAPTGGEGERDPRRAVAKKHAHFKRLLRAGNAREQMQKLALFGRSLHRSVRMVFGAFAQTAQRVGLSERDLAQVRGERVGEYSMNSGHQISMTSASRRTISPSFTIDRISGRILRIFCSLSPTVITIGLSSETPKRRL